VRAIFAHETFPLLGGKGSTGSQLRGLPAKDIFKSCGRGRVAVPGGAAAEGKGGGAKA